MNGVRDIRICPIHTKMLETNNSFSCFLWEIVSNTIMLHPREKWHVISHLSTSKTNWIKIGFLSTQIVFLLRISLRNKVVGANVVIKNLFYGTMELKCMKLEINIIMPVLWSLAYGYYYHTLHTITLFLNSILVAKNQLT